MKQYLDLLNKVVTHGITKSDRTGTGTKMLFSEEMRFNLNEGFPLVTTKQIYIKSVIHELLWFLKGDQHIDYLVRNNVHIWDAWANKDGWVGPLYGKQWRAWSNHGYCADIDQIQQLIFNIRKNPNSRRHLVSAWNVADLENMSLLPCHFAFQCVVTNEETLNMKVFLRSLDMFLGAPFDIASYAFLLQMIAHQTQLVPGELVISSTDTHVYLNHLDQVKKQLSRATYALPKFEWKISRPASIDQYLFDDLFNAVVNYKYHPAIPAPIAV